MRRAPFLWELRLITSILTLPSEILSYIESDSIIILMLVTNGVSTLSTISLIPYAIVFKELPTLSARWSSKSEENSTIGHLKNWTFIGLTPGNFQDWTLPTLFSLRENYMNWSLTSMSTDGMILACWLLMEWEEEAIMLKFLTVSATLLVFPERATKIMSNLVCLRTKLENTTTFMLPEPWLFLNLSRWLLKVWLNQKYLLHLFSLKIKRKERERSSSQKQFMLNFPISN